MPGPTTPFSITGLLRPFAAMARRKPRIPGARLGLRLARWTTAGGSTTTFNRSGKTTWSQFGETRLLLVHARSAFRDEGIVVENNMPFSDGESAFIFNGELRGVRIQSEGRIGAEKIYNYIRRFDKGDLCAATRRAVDIINKRSSYVRAMNLILSDGEAKLPVDHLQRRPAVFPDVSQAGCVALELVCSRPLDDETATGLPIDNHTTTPTMMLIKIGGGESINLEATITDLATLAATLCHRARRQRAA